MRHEYDDLDDDVKYVLRNCDVNMIAKSYESMYPEIWNRMFTKSINAPGNYYSSKTLAVCLTGAIEQTQDRLSSDGKNIDSNLPVVAGIMERFDFPTYYVSAPIMEALKRSHPPQGKTWKDIQFPFEGIAFMLPRGTLREPPEISGDDIMMIGACRFPANTKLTIPCVGRTTVGSWGEDRICIFWAVGPSGMLFNDCTFMSDSPLEPDANWIDEATKGRAERIRDHLGEMPLSSVPGEFSSQLAGVAANLLLVMAARKELIEPGKWFNRKSKAKGDKSLHLPTFIGRNYKILHKRSIPSDDPAMHFTKLGWRAGHFRQQHFGVNNEQVKTIWIEPYIAFTRGLSKE